MFIILYVNTKKRLNITFYEYVYKKKHMIYEYLYIVYYKYIVK